MKFFIFIILIPMIAGIVTAHNGASYFVLDELPTALAINIPICIISNLFYWSTGEYK
jgi:hypothetical protein